MTITSPSLESESVPSPSPEEELSPTYIIPDVFHPDVVNAVADAVSNAWILESNS